MDRSHKLDAPNNEELRTIEQIEDRSGLSTLYREPGEQFEGEILTTEAREQVKTEKLNAITSGIWKSSLKIGFYITYPLVSGALLGALLYLVVNWDNAAILLGLIIISGGVWVLTSYFAYAAIFKIFYKHALRTAPFIFVMLISIMLASQAFFTIVAANFAGQSLLFNVALVSLFTVIYSMAISTIILIVWGNAKIKAWVKALVAGLVIVLSGALIVVSYLL